MKIKFIYTSQIALFAKTDEEIVEIQNQANIQQAITALLLSKTEEFKQLLFNQSNTILQAILLIKNGNQIPYNDLSSLKDGDEIMIFSPMSGG
jgi:molybdopterin converting factor small subunit